MDEGNQIENEDLKKEMIMMNLKKMILFLIWSLNLKSFEEYIFEMTSNLKTI